MGSSRPGNVDYLALRQRLEQIDALLRAGGVEKDFGQRALQGWNPEGKTEVNAAEQIRFQHRSRRALRCSILRTLWQEDFRGFSCQLAGNPLYQWFCGVDALEVVRMPSKSELQRFSVWLPATEMRAVIEGLLRKAIQPAPQLELQEALDWEEYFLDSTCLKANLHDWTGRASDALESSKMGFWVGRSAPMDLPTGSWPWPGVS